MSADERAIRELIEAWLQATRDGDVERVLALMAPDAVFLAPGQAPMCGRDAFAAGLRGLLQTHAVVSESEVEEVEVAGDMAYSRTRLSVSIEPKDGGPPSHRSGRTLSVLRKGADGAWRLTRDANLLAPADPPE